MITLPFDTNFSRFIKRNNAYKINHSVKVVIDETIIECSGIILAQHSWVLSRLVNGSNEIYLDGFSGFSGPFWMDFN